MKNYFFTLFFILYLVNYSFSQISVSYEIKKMNDLYQSHQFVSGDWKKELTEKDISGSPYLNDEFVNGSVYTLQRLKYVDIPLRYNIYNDDLEFKTPSSEVQAMATPEIVEKAVFGNTQLVYLPYLLANKIKKGFFVVLEEGKASLYSKPVVMFKEPTEPGAYKEAEPAKFERKADEYYVRVGGEQAVLINNKKDLIAVFSENQDKIESFIKKNKINANKPDELKEVVQYYNSL